MNPNDISEMAKTRFMELTTGVSPYSFEWRSFYNGFLEGALQILAETRPVGTRGGMRGMGDSMVGETRASYHGPVEGDVSELPVEDQIRLYRCSGGSLDGERKLRATLEAAITKGAE